MKRVKTLPATTSAHAASVPVSTLRSTTLSSWTTRMIYPPQRSQQHLRHLLLRPHLRHPPPFPAPRSLLPPPSAGRQECTLSTWSPASGRWKAPSWLCTTAKNASSARSRPKGYAYHASTVTKQRMIYRSATRAEVKKGVDAQRTKAGLWSVWRKMLATAASA